MMMFLVAVAAILGISVVQGCGQPTLKGSRIVGGTVSKKGAWPWQVSLYYNRQFMCGGSLLNSRWVLTAAHCVDGFYASNYMVVLGDYNRDDRDHDEQYYRADRAFTHPHWNRNALNNDVALIRLSKPAKLTKYVQPVCLPSSAPVTGSLCFITGWGQTMRGRRGPLAATLKQARLQVVSQRDCYNKNTPSTGIAVTDKMVCGKWKDDPVDSGCHGDSGGPFVCQSHTGKWELQGSVSWGPARCDSRHGYSVFAKTYMFKSWIEQNIN